MQRCYPTTTDWSCYPGYPDEEPYTTIDAALKARSEMLAWQTLSARTGYQAGNCPQTVRPCAEGCGARGAWMAAPVSPAGLPGMTGSGWIPTLIDGSWFNVCGCSGPSDCGCSTLSQVRLPGPIGEVIEVRLDGVVVTPSAYRVDNFDRLVRTDGGVWPACQDMAKDLTEEGTFAVKYVQGFPADDSLNFAAGVLAMEYLKACTGDQSCRLPANVTSIARQGLTMEIDSRDPFTSVLTGIVEVDSVIAAFNPHGLRVRSSVLSPDQRRGRQTTWGR